MADKTLDLIKKEFFELAPFNISVIDKNFNLVTANSRFNDYFGNWQGKRCYEVYKKSDSVCSHCKIKEVIKTRQVRVSDESGVDKDGNPCHYVVHFVPVADENGDVIYVIEMSMNITDTTQWQKEYSILFERVPCFITILDKNLRIVRANQKYRDTFGEYTGKKCYQVYKNRRKPCSKCPAMDTFNDGKDHTTSEVGVSKTGKDIHYLVNSAPLSVNEDGVQLVIQISTDITEMIELENQIQHSHDFYRTLIQKSSNAIVALDRSGKVHIFNPAARELFDWKYNRKPGVSRIKEMMPEEFFQRPNKDDVISKLTETNIVTASNKEIPVSFNAYQLKSKKKEFGKAAFLQDLGPLKLIEKQCINTERFVNPDDKGEDITDIIMKRFDDLGIQINDLQLKLNKGENEQILEEFKELRSSYDCAVEKLDEMLTVTKPEFPVQTEISPKELILDVIQKLEEKANIANIELIDGISQNVRSALLDRKEMCYSIKNIVEYIIEKSQKKDKQTGQILIKTYDTTDNILVFEIEYIKLKIDFDHFRNFDLLRSIKIIRDHGGYYEIQSDMLNGGAFKILMPRSRLQMIAAEYYKQQKER